MHVSELIQLSWSERGSYEPKVVGSSPAMSIFFNLNAIPFLTTLQLYKLNRLSASSGTNPLLQTNKQTNKCHYTQYDMNKSKCTHNNTKKHMQGNENKNTNMFMKRANKHNRLSCLISTSISFHSMLFSNYQNLRICVYIVMLLTV